jgi:hypothetical protein
MTPKSASASLGSHPYPTGRSGGHLLTLSRLWSLMVMLCSCGVWLEIWFCDGRNQTAVSTPLAAAYQTSFAPLSITQGWNPRIPMPASEKKFWKSGLDMFAGCGRLPTVSHPGLVRATGAARHSCPSTCWRPDVFHLNFLFHKCDSFHEVLFLRRCRAASH